MKNYRIYINDSSLLITENLPKHMPDIQKLDVSTFDFLGFYKNLEKGPAGHYALVSADPKVLFKTVRNSCQLIKAAGGLVQNASGDFLFIFRNKRWDLPKGKVEKGEKMREAAVREVEEECGVKILKNKEKLCRTFHIYELNNKIVLKKTNWYSMTVKGSPKLIPQKEEGITKAEWLGKDGLKPVLKNTYPLIMDVLVAGALIT
ncbi:NUDIX hydrolase [Pedobacter duraquae]|uniref:NUDIX domain-containing protein n=1 Tax=Pedobacter duraquae TaxID=425511 RepID=A0A4R6IQQ1_9SPHI|nr:NUDIX domain-containing protein [Pedobacter duraquae]TDO24669.1 NUDIX domain-containing protein [Pedobacter duraquae]